jgi:hypothetical protein
LGYFEPIHRPQLLPQILHLFSSNIPKSSSHNLSPILGKNC